MKWTTAKSSRQVTQHCLSGLDSTRLSKVTTCSLYRYPQPVTAQHPVSRMKGFEKSRKTRMDADVRQCFSSQKACLQSGVHRKLAPFSVSQCRGLTRVAKF